jgi:hypothetical protein
MTHRTTNAPAAANEWLREARGLFRSFHCFDAPRVLRSPCQCGQPRTFVHFFETPAHLTCDSRGRQLYIQGGRYRVTTRGIEG